MSFVKDVIELLIMTAPVYALSWSISQLAKAVKRPVVLHQGHEFKHRLAAEDRSEDARG